MTKQKSKTGTREHLRKKAIALLHARQYRRAHKKYQALLKMQTGHLNKFSNFREFQNYIITRTQLFVCDYLSAQNETDLFEQIKQLDKAKTTLLALMQDLQSYTNKDFYRQFIKSNISSYLGYISTKKLDFEGNLAFIDEKLSLAHEQLGDIYFDEAEAINDKNESIRYFKLAEEAYEQGNLVDNDPARYTFLKESRVYCHFLIFKLTKNIEDKRHHANKIIVLGKEINHDTLSDWSLLTLYIYIYKAYAFLENSEAAKMYAEKIAACELFQYIEEIYDNDVKESLIEIKELLNSLALQQDETPMLDSSEDDIDELSQNSNAEPDHASVDNHESKIATNISRYQGKFITDATGSSTAILASLEDESMLLKKIKEIEFDRFKKGKRYSVEAIRDIDKTIAVNYELFCQCNPIQYSKLQKLSSQIPFFIELLRVTDDRSKRMMLAICVELIRYALNNQQEMLMAKQTKAKELALEKSIHEVKKLKGKFKPVPDVFSNSMPKNARMLLNDLDIRANAEAKRTASVQSVGSDKCAASVKFTPRESFYYTKLNSFFNQSTYSINENHMKNAGVPREKLESTPLNNPLQVHLHVKARMLSESTDEQLNNYLRSLNMEPVEAHAMQISKKGRL